MQSHSLWSIIMKQRRSENSLPLLYKYPPAPGENPAAADFQSRVSDFSWFFPLKQQIPPNRVGL